MATKGTSWCLRRSIDLIPYLLFTAAREALIEPREWAAEPGAAVSASIDALAGVRDRARAGAGEAQAQAQAQAAESVAE